MLEIVSSKMVIHSKGKNNIYKIFFDEEDVKVHWT